MAIPGASSFKEIVRRIRESRGRKQDTAVGDLLSGSGDEEVVRIIDSLPPGEKVAAFAALAPDRRARVAIDLPSFSRDEVLAALSYDALRVTIDAAESDVAVDIIQHLPATKRERLIVELRKEDPRGILPLLVFDKHTAGGRMKTEALIFAPTRTVEDVRRSLSGGTGKLVSHFLYVVDAQGGFVGSVAPLRLLQAQPEATLADVMNRAVVSVPPTMDQERVAQVFDEHNAIELPVVGTRNRFLGIITADDIFEVMEEEFAEDVSRMAGLHTDAHINDPVSLSVRRRMPWLLINLATAILAGWVVSLFQDTIQRVVILAAMMPIIAGMGGNAATQTLGVTIRALALGHLHHLNTVLAISKEIFIGAFNGFLNGVVMGGIAWLWTHDLKLAIIMVAAMTGNLLIAGLSGVGIPVLLKALRVDPALAATVFVTTMTDVGGFFLLLGMASKFLV